MENKTTELTTYPDIIDCKITKPSDFFFDDDLSEYYDYPPIIEKELENYLKNLKETFKDRDIAVPLLAHLYVNIRDILKMYPLFRNQGTRHSSVIGKYNVALRRLFKINEYPNDDATEISRFRDEKTGELLKFKHDSYDYPLKMIQNIETSLIDFAQHNHLSLEFMEKVHQEIKKIFKIKDTILSQTELETFKTQLLESKDKDIELLKDEIAHGFDVIRANGNDLEKACEQLLKEANIDLDTFELKIPENND